MSGALRPRSDPAVDEAPTRIISLFYSTTLRTQGQGVGICMYTFGLLCACVLESLDWVEVYWWSLQALKCLSIKRENLGEDLNTLALSSFC